MLFFNTKKYLISISVGFVCFVFGQDTLRFDPKIKEVMVEWIKNGVNLTKLQKLPVGRKKKLGR